MIRLNQPLARLSALSLWLILLSLTPAHAQQEAVPAATDEVETSDDQERVVVYPDADEALKDQTRAERSEALDRRAGEQIGDDPQGRAGVLGMYVQEADGDRVEVVEVGAATPAFDAGIRKGDVLISFDGFKADSYRKWVDGIRKLVNDAPEGDTMPIQLVRDGKRLNLRLRKSVARADDIRIPPPETLNQQVAQQGQLPTQPIPVPQPTQGTAGSGVGVGLLGGDFFGSQFNDIQGGATEVAVAEIFPVLQGPRQSDITTPTGRATDTQRSDAAEQGFQATGDDANTRAQRNARSGLGTTRIGIAGFRDSDNGLLVMLDVGGLAPGNYLVGIGDAGMIATPGSVGAGTSFAPAGTPATTPQRVQNRTARPLPPDQDIPTSAPAPADGQPTNRVTPPASRERAPGRAQPQGSNQQQQIPRTVLAQVVEGVEADPSAAGATNGASAGQAQPVTPGGPEQPLIPNTGQVDPLDTPPIGQARTSQDTQRDGALGDRTGQDTGLETGDAGIGSASIGTGTGLGPTVNVGTLTVDQSGTGRLQQVVEGVQVQQVVGQAIVILSDQVSPNTALPANLNAAGAATPDQAAAAQRNAADQTRPGDLRRGTARPPTASNQTVPPTAVGGQGVGNPMPVAAGIIRLMSDRRPNDGLDAGQPAASLPTTGQDLR